MKDRVYTRVRLVGCSREGIEEAVALALAKAGSAGPVAWFEVVEIRGAVVDGAPAEWQVTVEAGCRVE